MDRNVELLCSYWTASGIVPAGGCVSRFGFRERAEAAARAGFRGIGLWHSDLEHILTQMSLMEMKRILDGSGLRYAELEFLEDWFADGAKKEEADRRRRMLLDAAEVLSVRDIKAGDFNNTPCPWECLVESFAELCRDFGECGALVGYEFMGCANVGNLQDALKMAREAGAPNGGIMLDILHAVIQKIPHEEIARIPAKYLVGVELNDGALPGSPLYDPERERRFCGEGDFDIRGFIQAVQETGYNGPWGVEVYSKDVAELEVNEVTQRAYKTSVSQFD